MVDKKVVKQDFDDMFRAALDKAAASAESRLSVNVPREYIIELHGAGATKMLLGVEEAIDRLFVDDFSAYKKIDIAVIQIKKNKTIVFVRASGYGPVPWQESFNFAEGEGPFDQLCFEDIEVHL